VKLVGLAFSETSLDYLATVPRKLRQQIIKKAQALLNDPFPQSCKALKGMTTAAGETVHRQRSGDYRILYVVRATPPEIVILDINHRKDVYR
jgi:mRNA interferase RelE/StbE